MSFIEDLQRMADQLRVSRQPGTYVQGFLASHEVPYSKTYRYYNTNGHLFVWVNQGRIHDMIRKVSVLSTPVTMAGIPVYHSKKNR